MQLFTATFVKKKQMSHNSIATKTCPTNYLIKLTKCQFTLSEKQILAIYLIKVSYKRQTKKIESKKESKNLVLAIIQSYHRFEKKNKAK